MGINGLAYGAEIGCFISGLSRLGPSVMETASVTMATWGGGGAGWHHYHPPGAFSFFLSWLPSGGMQLNDKRTERTSRLIWCGSRRNLLPIQSNWSAANDASATIVHLHCRTILLASDPHLIDECCRLMVPAASISSPLPFINRNALTHSSEHGLFFITLTTQQASAQ